MSPGKRAIAGLVLSSTSALMYELLLTRIFSVTLYYHLAFVAISVAMFGAAVGATLVYVRRRRSTEAFPYESLAWLSAAGGAAVILCVAVYVHMPTVLRTSDDMVALIAGYVVVSVPFICFGALTTIALSHASDVSSLYAADLCGAAVGCLAVIFVLRAMSAPAAMFVTAGIAILSSVVMSKRPLVYAGGLVLLSTLGLLNGQTSLLKLRTAKGFAETTPLLERWNTFSRVQVLGNPSVPRKPFGWGFSPRFVPAEPVRELDISIDAASGTVLTAFDGDIRRLDYLRYDISNVAHFLRPNARVAVIGSGGGRDVLSALAFHQQSVVGIEVNENILRILNRDFGDFSGHLDRRPGVRFVNAEARTYLNHARGDFDIIQISLIDTWAATAAGAFALTENALYTTEAWQTFLRRLSTDGVLTVTRWYRYPRPFEIIRLCNLAGAALRSAGVADPRSHIAVVMTRSSNDVAPTGVATLLVFKQPIDAATLDRLETIAHGMQWQVVLSPTVSSDPLLARAATATDRDPLLDATGVEWRAPSDDRPFFFYTARLRSLLGGSPYPAPATHQAWLLLAVLAAVTALSCACILLPLARITNREGTQRSLPLVMFFAAIGFAFMFVEVSQLQRLGLILGHPVYALSIVLFTLLVTSGIGARFSRSIRVANGLMGIVLVCSLTAIVEPSLLRFVEGSELPVRIVAAVALVAPAGFVMGLAFPFGMRLATKFWPAARPWFIGTNAAASVCASVLAMIVSLHSSTTATYWLGVASYAIAAAAALVVERREITAAITAGIANAALLEE